MKTSLDSDLNDQEPGSEEHVAAMMLKQEKEGNDIILASGLN
jgi:hypothetical protein